MSNRYEALTEATIEELFYAVGNSVANEDGHMVQGLKAPEGHG